MHQVLLRHGATTSKVFAVPLQEGLFTTEVFDEEDSHAWASRLSDVIYTDNAVSGLAVLRHPAMRKALIAKVSGTFDDSFD